MLPTERNRVAILHYYLICFSFIAMKQTPQEVDSQNRPRNVNESYSDAKSCYFRQPVRNT